MKPLHPPRRRSDSAQVILFLTVQVISVVVEQRLAQPVERPERGPEIARHGVMERLQLGEHAPVSPTTCSSWR